MEVIIHHLGNVRFEATARGHRVLCDQPFENHGSDAGMTPPELLLSSLGTCAGYYAAEYLRTLPTTDEASPAEGTLVTALQADQTQLGALVSQLERAIQQTGCPRGADD